MLVTSRVGMIAVKVLKVIDSWLFVAKDKNMAAAGIPLAVSALQALPAVLPLLKSLVSEITKLHTNTGTSASATDLESAVSQAVVPVTNLLQQNGVITSTDASQLSGAIQALIHTQQTATPKVIDVSSLSPASGTIVNADGKSYSFSGTVVLTPQ